MTPGKQQKGKRIALIALAAICALLVWRNLIQPARQNAAGSTVSASDAGTSTDLPSPKARPATRNASPGDSGRRDTVLDEQELAALDPTLRLDLLEQTGKVKYQGGTRNIFQFYTPPPPKPVANPVVASPGRPLPSQPAGPPPAPPMPLKFYGISSRPGRPEKKAFLTDGDDIIIGQEGDVVGKHYKIVRIGVNSLEWEDTVTHQKGQAPLVEE